MYIMEIGRNVSYAYECRSSGGCGIHVTILTTLLHHYLRTADIVRSLKKTYCLYTTMTILNKYNVCSMLLAIVFIDTRVCNTYV